MVIAPYLAQTALEFSRNPLDKNMAYMACHFAPYGLGLTNLPNSLPKNSLLILNDRTPVRGHSAKEVARTLARVCQRFSCCGILLDFQQEKNGELLEIVKAVAALPYPVAVSDLYAREIACGVFLPPVPLWLPLPQYIKPWRGRRIWLDICLSAGKITLTPQGSRFETIRKLPQASYPFEDKQLHCRYRTEVSENSASFYLHRDRACLDGLLQEARALGVEKAVGLYQQLG